MIKIYFPPNNNSVHSLQWARSKLTLSPTLHKRSLSKVSPIVIVQQTPDRSPPRLSPLGSQICGAGSAAISPRTRHEKPRRNVHLRRNSRHPPTRRMPPSVSRAEGSGTSDRILDLRGPHFGSLLVVRHAHNEEDISRVFINGMDLSRVFINGMNIPFFNPPTTTLSSWSSNRQRQLGWPSSTTTTDFPFTFRIGGWTSNSGDERFLGSGRLRTGSSIHSPNRHYRQNFDGRIRSTGDDRFPGSGRLRIVLDPFISRLFYVRICDNKLCVWMNVPFHSNKSFRLPSVFLSFMSSGT